MHRRQQPQQQYRPKPPSEIRKWRTVKGDQTLRLDYPLTSESVVFDLGGYKGEWAQQIYDRYKCHIHVFEPVPALAVAMKTHFSTLTDKIHIYDFGLSNKDTTLKLSYSDDGSSFYQSSSTIIDANVKSIIGFLKDNHIHKIDLIKLNIEGDEYAVLNELLDHNFIDNITDIQVQFHDFVPNAKSMRDDIRNRLSQTHECTYNFVFIWENWTRKRS